MTPHPPSEAGEGFCPNCRRWRSFHYETAHSMYKCGGCGNFWEDIPQAPAGTPRPFDAAATRLLLKQAGWHSNPRDLPLESERVWRSEDSNVQFFATPHWWSAWQGDSGQVMLTGGYGIGDKAGDSERRLRCLLYAITGDADLLPALEVQS